MAKSLPIGIEDFKELIENEYYYVDKTGFVKELLTNRSKVSLFMRPRRFGKTLCLSMLKYFFEKIYKPDGNTEDNSHLFLNLKIMSSGKQYIKYMGQYPVISLSLKSAKQPNFSLAYTMLKRQIANEFRRHRYITEKLEDCDRERFLSIMKEAGDISQYLDSLAFLSRILTEIYGKKTIILIDEYDVPLENAFFCGFYNEMTDFIRSLFESALKTNENLEFAIITGCIVSTEVETLEESSILHFRGKESIFTGLNNPRMVSVLNVGYGEFFGFTQPEVDQMLKDYGIIGLQDEIKAWYDGYLFGKTEVYNPWSILSYIDDLRQDKETKPRPYWANTSSNSIVRELIEHADGSVKQEMEALISGGTIEKPVHEEITYEDVSKTEDNLWNFLFFTGYLKKQGERFDGEIIYLTLAIPNTEVRLIYRNTILDWFNTKIKQKDFTELFHALLKKDTHGLEQNLSECLMETISFYDYREDYYHGFLGGLLKMMQGYTVKSNRENGLGRSELLLLSAPYDGIAIIIEIKVTDIYAELEQKAKYALNQIEEKQYDAELKLEGYHTFIKYGIAFYKKLCKVLCK